MKEFLLPHDHGPSYGDIISFRKELLCDEHFNIAAEFFKTLSDPTRIRLFWLLCHREECIINLAAMLDISSPAVSHHMRPLRQGGLVVSRRDGKEVYYKAADTELCRLLHHMVEQVMDIACPKEEASARLSRVETMHQVHDYLINHLDQRITIEALAKKFLLNTTTLKEAFKEEYGDSIAVHTKKHRMEKAASLLSRTDMSIASVAKAVGFESQSKFTSAFKEAFGVLPAAYRSGERSL